MKLMSMSVLGFIVFLSGCASMFGTGFDEITLESEPSGADVYFRNQYLGKTPLTTKLARTPEAPFLVFKKAGYEDQRVSMGRSVDGVAFFNLGFITTTSGATSWGIDAITGRMWKVSQNTYVVKLERLNRADNDHSHRTMDYVLNQSEELKSELSQGYGESFKSLCKAANVGMKHCPQVYSKALSDKGSLLASRNSLEFYRRLSSQL